MITNKQIRVIIENPMPEIDGGRFPIKKSDANQDIKVETGNGF